MGDPHYSGGEVGSGFSDNREGVVDRSLMTGISQAYIPPKCVSTVGEDKGSKKADLTGKSWWYFFALPSIPSRKAGGEVVDDPHYSGGEVGNGFSDNREGVVGRSLKTGIPQAYIPPKCVSTVGEDKGGKKADLTGESWWCFFTLPSIPSRKAGGEVVGDPSLILLATLSKPFPKASLLWGRIKEGAERVNLTGESWWCFFTLPSIPSRKVGGKVVGVPHYSGVEIGNGFSDNREGVAGRSLKTGIPQAYTPPKCVSIVEEDKGGGRNSRSDRGKLVVLFCPPLNPLP